MLAGGLLAALQACATMPGPVVRVEEGDSRQEIGLKTGEFLEIRLIDPGRGLTITLGSVVTPVLVLAGEPTFHEVRAGIGATTGYESWVFKAVQPGNAQVRMDFRRSWDVGGVPVRSVTYEVVVQ